MTALDRALDSTTVVDWRVIRQIIQRQTSLESLFGSLKRLLRVPRVPIDLIQFILTRIEGTLGEYEISTIDVMLCVKHIWYNVLVDRESGAPREFLLGDPFEASKQYTSELLAVTDDASLRSNEAIYNAFELTKLVVLELSWRGLWNDMTNRDSVLFLPLVTKLKLPPFFFWLAVAEDPNCLLSFELNNGSLPLHRALRTVKLFAARPCLSLIRFPTEHLTDQVDHVADATVLDLFNKRTAVQLLCHLAPQACRTGIPNPDSTSADDVRYVLDLFLCSIQKSSCFPSSDGPPVLGFVLSHQELLDDIHAVISNSPMALVTRNPDFGLYRFCLPQLQDFASERSFSTVESENRACFSLSMAYDLLRSNPTVITRHVYDDSSLTVPHAAHETVLTQPVQLERKNSHEIESLKRAIAALQKDVEMLKRRKA